MTCIVALETADKIYIAGDSASVEYQTLRMNVRPDEKVFLKEHKNNQPMLVGFCASWRVGQLVRYRLDVPKHPAGMYVDEYLISTFIPALQTCFQTSNAILMNNGNNQSLGQFVIAYCGRLFTIETDFHLAHHSCGFVAVGSGADLAMGSLFTSAKYPSNPKERVTMALDAACAFNAGVCRPYTIKSVGRKK